MLRDMNAPAPVQTFEAAWPDAMARYRRRFAAAPIEAVSGAVLTAAPRYGPGVPLQSLIAIVARQLKAPPSEIAWAVRAATLDLEAGWRLRRVRGARPARWRRFDPDDRIVFEAGACGARGDWPPL